MHVHNRDKIKYTFRCENIFIKKSDLQLWTW